MFCEWATAAGMESGLARGTALAFAQGRWRVHRALPSMFSVLGALTGEWPPAPSPSPGPAPSPASARHTCKQMPAPAGSSALPLLSPGPELPHRLHILTPEPFLTSGTANSLLHAPGLGWKPSLHAPGLGWLSLPTVLPPLSLPVNALASPCRGSDYRPCFSLGPEAPGEQGHVFVGRRWPSSGHGSASALTGYRVMECH